MAKHSRLCTDNFDSVDLELLSDVLPTEREGWLPRLRTMLGLQVLSDESPTAYIMCVISCASYVVQSINQSIVYLLTGYTSSKTCTYK